MKDNLLAWPRRPWILAAFLAVAGFAFYLIVEEKILGHGNPQLRVAVGTFIAVGALSSAFALERVRLLWVALFSFIWGLVLAFVAHSTLISATGDFNFSFAFTSGLLSAGIALPLFQTIRKHGELVLPYRDLHAAAWSDVICWCASWFFVGLSFALAFLLAALFDLIGIELLKDLLREEWFTSIFAGASFGAALGVLKENDRIVSSLQNLVMTILSILAPVLCVSLVLFLLALPFTGLQPFWDATRGTTPILLSCALGAIALLNAVIRNATSEESTKVIMRYSAIGLSLCVLPLAFIALISMQVRVTQYGLTPDRIWGLLAVLIAVIYGLAYLWSLIRQREVWASNLRTNNTRVAIFLCLIALFLALPIVNFSETSVASQLKRIEDGRTSSDQIDFAAFAFDFGDAGRNELKRMQGSHVEVVARRAAVALAADNRWELKRKVSESDSDSVILSRLTVFPESVTLPDSLKKAINKDGGCLKYYCLLLWNEGETLARFVTPACSGINWYSRIHLSEDSYQHCPPSVTLFAKKEKGWVLASRSGYRNDYRTRSVRKAQEQRDSSAVTNAIRQGEIEIRTVERKQIFIGGKPIGDAY